MTDPLPLAQALLRCPSVTPDDAGAQDVLAAALERAGFAITRLPFGTTPNLWARRGTAGPHFCFAGHTDVVPAGDNWQHDPFAGEVRDGILYGRGAVDMKGAIAAFAAAADGHSFPGSISFLITGDEEGPAYDGTTRVLDWLAAHDQVPDFCLVGEPTNPARLGEVIKIGRRGSLNAAVTVHGTQGHVAYPHRVDNPVHRLTNALSALLATPLDAGSEWFEPSTLQVTSVDVGNPATNVVPAEARARLNIRFNDHHNRRQPARAHRPHPGRSRPPPRPGGRHLRRKLPNRAPAPPSGACRPRSPAPAASNPGSTPAAAPPTPASSPASAPWPSSA